MLRTSGKTTRIITTLLFVAAGSAQAQDLTLADDTNWTAVSGYSGSYETLGLVGDVKAGYRIDWWEHRDKPCKFQLSRRDFNSGDIGKPSVKLDGNSGKVSLGTKPCSSPGNHKQVGLGGTSDWIYKVQVCTTDKKNTSKNRLKGIRLWARTVNERSPLSISTQSTYQERRHTNCRKWRNAVSCPAGKIASRIRVHHDASEEYATGIALECRTLRAI